jgi:hypothetical protein
MALAFQPGKEAQIHTLEGNEPVDVKSLLEKAPLTVVFLSRHMGA